MLCQFQYLIISLLLLNIATRIVSRQKAIHSKSVYKKEYEYEPLTQLNEPRRPASGSSNVCASEATVERILAQVTSCGKDFQVIRSLNYWMRKYDISLSDHREQVTQELDQIEKRMKLQILEGGNILKSLDGLRMDMGKLMNHSWQSTRRSAFSNNLKVPSEFRDIHHIIEIKKSLANLSNSVQQIYKFVSKEDSRSESLGYRRVAKNENVMVDARNDAAAAGADNIMSRSNEYYMKMNKKCECKKTITEKFPADCNEIKNQGYNITGIYKIKPENSEAFYVLCELTASGEDGAGGWTVFQNRYDGSQDFYKNWQDYENGFGNLAGEFWLGLEKLYHLTNQKLYELRVELESYEHEEAYATYSVFTIGPRVEGYRISTLGIFLGTAGDSLTYHSGQKFSTFDVDNDLWNKGNCAIEHGGAWWYRECDKSNLNGKYESPDGDISKRDGIYWNTFKGPNYSLIKSRMMIRPLAEAQRHHDNDDLALDHTANSDLDEDLAETDLDIYADDTRRETIPIEKSEPSNAMCPEKSVKSTKIPNVNNERYFT